MGTNETRTPPTGGTHPAHRRHVLIMSGAVGSLSASAPGLCPAEESRLIDSGLRRRVHEDGELRSIVPHDSAASRTTR